MGELISTGSIADNKRMKIGDYFKATWYFEKLHEKAILIILCALGVFKIFQWVF